MYTLRIQQTRTNQTAIIHHQRSIHPSCMCACMYAHSHAHESIHTHTHTHIYTPSGFGKQEPIRLRSYTTKEAFTQATSLSFLLNSVRGPVRVNRTGLQKLFLNSTLFEQILVNFEEPSSERFPDSPLDRYVCMCVCVCVWMMMMMMDIYVYM